MSEPTPILKRRGVILSVSAIVIIAVGAFSGAMLKTDVQKQQVAYKIKAETVDDRVDRLKGYRTILELQKKGLEDKLSTLRAKKEEESE